jgi:hypothetical protein
MCNHTAAAKALKAACALAVALLLIGIGVSTTCAGSDEQGTKFVSIPRLAVFSHYYMAGRFHLPSTLRRSRFRLAECLPTDSVCMPFEYNPYTDGPPPKPENNATGSPPFSGTSTIPILPSPVYPPAISDYFDHARCPSWNDEVTGNDESRVYQSPDTAIYDAERMLLSGEVSCYYIVLHFGDVWYIRANFTDDQHTHREESIVPPPPPPPEP